MSESSRCKWCHSVGVSKGRDQYNHVHCRKCSTNTVHSQRSDLAEGESWSIYCKGTAKRVTVTAMKNIRVEPREYEVRMISVVVGKDEAKDTFVIEEPLLTDASPYFKNALQTTFKEGIENRVELEEEDPAIFGLLNEYIHIGDVWQKRVYSDVTPTMSEYCRLWLLAHYLQIEPLMNHAMHNLIGRMDEASDKLAPEEIEDLYARAPMESALRKFLIHYCVWAEVVEFDAGVETDTNMVLELYREEKRKGAGNVRTPLMDVRHYYVGDEAVREQEESSAPRDWSLADGVSPLEISD